MGGPDARNYVPPACLCEDEKISKQLFRRCLLQVNHIIGGDQDATK
jgi:hypothetical protein